LKLIATAAFGIEGLTADELRNLGFDNLVVENGRVTFETDFAGLCRANLWLRTAERILVSVGQFEAYTFDQLFEQTKALPWEEWLPQNACFPVNGKSINSDLFSISDCQAIVKKAIVERLKSVYHIDWFEEDGPQYTIEVGLLKDVATLTIDTSGPGLHKRGYRVAAGPAPIKETLASALLNISYWNWDRVLHDPLCGSGTIPIEAAMISANIAPGLSRKFVSQEWPNIPESVWKAEREQAFSQIIQDREIKIIGTDRSDKAISLARHHAEEAGVEHLIHFQKMDLKDISSKEKYGFIITNPPYGTRMNELEEAEELYVQMGKAFAKLDTWSVYVISSHMNFEKFYGKPANKKRKLFNGRIQCNYYQFFGPPPKRKRPDAI